jgi:predicted transcriptional regulator
MAHVHLDAREFLEARRLEGCEWAPELLDMLDDRERLTWLEGLAEGVGRLVPADRRKPICERGFERLEEALQERVHLLEAVTEVFEEFAEGFEFDPRDIELDDKLRAMFESSRWQKYDL